MKSFLTYTSFVSIGIFGFAISFLAKPLPAHAQTATTEDTRAFLSSGTTNASTTYPGGQHIFYGQLSTALPTTNALVNIELHNQDGQKIVQYSWDNVTLQQQKSPDIIYTLSPDTNLTPGVYTWKIGIFRPGWTGLINWYDSAATFTVVGTTTTTVGTTTATSTPSLYGTWQPRQTLTSGNSNYLSAEFGGGSQANPAFIEISLFDSSNRLVASRSWDFVTVPARETISKTLTTPPLQPGEYHWGVGIFTAQRKQLHTWYESPQTFMVRPS